MSNSLKELNLNDHKNWIISDLIFLMFTNFILEKLFGNKGMLVSEIKK